MREWRRSVAPVLAELRESMIDHSFVRELAWVTAGSARDLVISGASLSLGLTALTNVATVLTAAAAPREWRYRRRRRPCSPARRRGRSSGARTTITCSNCNVPESSQDVHKSSQGLRTQPSMARHPGGHSEDDGGASAQVVAEVGRWIERRW